MKRIHWALLKWQTKNCHHAHFCPKNICRSDSSVTFDAHRNERSDSSVISTWWNCHFRKLPADMELIVYWKVLRKSYIHIYLLQFRVLCRVVCVASFRWIKSQLQSEISGGCVCKSASGWKAMEFMNTNNGKLNHGDAQWAEDTDRWDKNKAGYTALGAPKHLYKRVNEKA